MEKLTTNTRLDTALEEMKMVKELEKQKEDCTGLRICGLSKTFPGGILSDNKDDVRAIRNLWIEVNEGECLGIMGHNGAGKTTLVNVISGMMNPTSGNARIYNQQLIEDLEDIRSKLGVVFQYDVLWDELTGFEHLWLFAQIKRIKEEGFEEMATARLKDVGLAYSGTLSVGQYSGGMRRRMSVALSSIGDPKIILMDEPTTGMDPVSKKAVWDLIQKLKGSRVIILTTHAMEEAELLSDKLCVLEEGQLRCIGAPLQLKNIYGDGYRVNILCSTHQSKQVTKLVQKVMPDAVLVDDSGSIIIFNVPF